jgi:hypothetical protein
MGAKQSREELLAEVRDKIRDAPSSPKALRLRDRRVAKRDFSQSVSASQWSVLDQNETDVSVDQSEHPTLCPQLKLTWVAPLGNGGGTDGRISLPKTTGPKARRVAKRDFSQSVPASQWPVLDQEEVLREIELATVTCSTARSVSPLASSPSRANLTRSMTMRNESEVTFQRPRKQKAACACTRERSR